MRRLGQQALFAKLLHPGIAQRLAGKAWAQNAGDLVMRRALYA
jgi:hypothetical protein